MRVRETSAIPVGLRSRVPAKMTSSIFTPRRDLADCSPRAQVMASEMLDLPHPFGPTTAAIPSPERWTSVRSQKDLKPSIWTFLSLSNCDLFAEGWGRPLPIGMTGITLVVIYGGINGHNTTDCG